MVIGLSAGIAATSRAEAAPSVPKTGGTVVPFSSLPALADVKQAVLDSWGGIAVHGDGTVTRWGSEKYGLSAETSSLSGVKSVALGSGFGVALLSDGTVTTWGQPMSGISIAPPTGLVGVTAVAAGHEHVLALLADGSVVAWGSDTRGSVSGPNGMSDVAAIAAAGYDSMVLKKDGTVLAWGGNSNGENDVPDGLSDVTSIVTDGWQSAAVKSDGSVVAWGAAGAAAGQVPASTIATSIAVAGDIVAITRPDGTVSTWGCTADELPCRVPDGLRDVVSVAGHSGSFVAVKSDGTLVGWGARYWGPSLMPSTLNDITSVSIGERHALAVRHDGSVVSWGVGAAAEVPSGLTGVTAVAAGPDYSMALKADGTVTEWGSLGTESVPSGLSDVTAIAAGAGHNRLALKSDGTVVAWGDPGAVDVASTLTNVTGIAAGYWYRLAVNGDGTVTAWDWSGLSDLGITVADAVAIASGDYHGVALRADGTVATWGYDSSFGETVVPDGLNGVAAIAAGGSTSLALKSDGTVVAFGEAKAVPTTVTNAFGIAAGGHFGVALVAPPAEPPAAGSFKSLTPSRILDTRNHIGLATTTPVPAQGSVTLAVAGVGGVPQTGASAVVLNVTAVTPSQPGWIAVYPSGTELPNVSNVNFVPGQVVPNLVTVKLGADGNVVLKNGSSGTVHLVADVSGYYVAGKPTEAGAFNAVAPVRILDTREAIGIASKTPVAAAGDVKVQVTGVGGVPDSNVAAVVLNVTETGPTAPGWIAAYPAGTDLPVVSNLNFVAGDTRPNLVTVKVSTDGFVALHNGSSGTVHLIADVAGYYLGGTPTKAGMFVPVTPTRLLDTRSALGVATTTPLASNAMLILPIAGKAAIPSTGVAAAVLNVTETQPSKPGWIAAYPAGSSLPVVSNLNFVPNDTYPNSVVVKIGANGSVALTNGSEGTIHLIADIAGYFLS